MLKDERTYYKPFNYPWAYDAWLKHEQSHWLHTEVPMKEDVKDWKNKLTDEKFRQAVFDIMDEEIIMKFDKRIGSAEEFYEEE